MIVKVQGRSFSNEDAVRDALEQVKSGERLSVIVLRDGRLVELSMAVP